MNAEELWTEFCFKKGIDIDTPYEAWAFGGEKDASDELAQLVLAGRKIGTASLYDAYVAEDALDMIPKAGDYSVIMNSKEEALCVVRDYDVYTRLFKEVSPFHAYSEGEGNRSLGCWREVHRAFFDQDALDTGVKFTEESKVICEKFSVEYVPGKETFDEDELIFVEPTMLFSDEITAYRQEMLDADSSFDGCFSMKGISDPKEYVDCCINWANPSREPDEHGAWGTVLLAIRKSDMKMIGCMQIHNVLTQRMRDYTGHVGYSVRPSERGHGYAKKMLAKALDFLNAFGFEEVYVSCLPDNIASKKTILANGGEFAETVFLESDKVFLEKYRFIL
ncbi:MAG: GNAT family N-acetyltransferase [Butyrivibrio sp.]|nr:GNAT family N-acetyltransferase [Butyrivibrio sp.]